LRVGVPSGLVLKSLSTAVQNMVVSRVLGERRSEATYRPEDVIELNDDAEHSYAIDAYCLDFDKDNPSADDRFVIGDVDARSMALFKALAPQAEAIGVVQAAVWLAAGISEERIKERFSVTDDEMRAARAVVQALEGPGR
jgi:hypothetical protein